MDYTTKDRARFWSHVEKTETCWLWKRAQNGGGYAFFKLGRKMVLGHRFAYHSAVHPIPPGSVVDHMCRVRHCVNPAHLQVATAQENAENLDTTPDSNRTGHLNVYKRSNAFGYVVIVRSGGQRHYGGSHATIEAAAEAARILRNQVKGNNLQDRRGDAPPLADAS